MNINNGMTGKQQFGNLICSQPTMAITPFFIQVMMQRIPKVKLIVSTKVGEYR